MTQSPSMLKRFASYYKKYALLFFAELFGALRLAGIERV